MRFATRQGGSASVEMAFLLLPLLFIVFGITEFGRAMFEYNTIAKATRDAARFLSIQQPSGASAAEARCLAVHGNTTCSGATLTPNLTTGMVTICDWTSCPGTHNAQGTNPVVNLVTVTVTGYPFTSNVPFATPGLASITFGDIRTTMKSNL